MSCAHCDVKFNLFHKELGCSNCGLSLCSKCLQQKCQIPSKGSGEYKVCRVCYAKLKTDAETKDATVLPPDRFLKRLENLQNPAAPPITVYREDSKMSVLKSGLSSRDRDIVDRLEKLKEKRPLPPSDSELKERLAKLKDDAFASSGSSAQPLYTPDLRSDQEKIDGLLEQLNAEQNIDRSRQSQDDLARRLATLKGEQANRSAADQFDDAELDSEEEVDQITKKIVSKVSLDERCPIGSSRTMVDDDEDVRTSSPELPWCVLCNNDATYRCYDCGGDLYCNSCNIEVHKNWGDTDHKVVPYKQQ